VGRRNDSGVASEAKRELALPEGKDRKHRQRRLPRRLPPRTRPLPAALDVDDRWTGPITYNKLTTADTQTFGTDEDARAATRVSTPSELGDDKGKVATDVAIGIGKTGVSREIT